MAWHGKSVFSPLYKICIQNCDGITLNTMLECLPEIGDKFVLYRRRRRSTIHLYRKIGGETVFFDADKLVLETTDIDVQLDVMNLVTKFTIVANLLSYEDNETRFICTI